MHISIDQKAGFCTGVKRAIQKAEEELAATGSLYCLGQIVHNEEEEQRLKAMGLKVIDQEEFKRLHDVKVLIRAHGEPPETYRIARENNIELIDATCPVVLNLQKKIKDAYQSGKSKKTQVVIYGRENHPEVIGLNGQISFKAIVIEKPEDIEKIDFSRPVSLFAQTTKDKSVYDQIIQNIEDRKTRIEKGGDLHFSFNKSICGQVSNRDENLREFARKNDVVVFVGGEHSSNGHYLFSICKNENPNSFYVGAPEMIDSGWFKGNEQVGVTGATSTPEWLLKSTASAIAKLTR
jgi:4-hydroxy-3-methylbut-2-enyl diphosphate reductase